MEKKEMKEGVFNECLLMNFLPTGCPHGQGEGGQPNADNCRQGDGGLKITKTVRTSFMDGPYVSYFRFWSSYYQLLV